LANPSFSLKVREQFGSRTVRTHLYSVQLSSVRFRLRRTLLCTALQSSLHSSVRREGWLTPFSSSSYPVESVACAAGLLLPAAPLSFSFFSASSSLSAPSASLASCSGGKTSVFTSIRVVRYPCTPGFDCKTTDVLAGTMAHFMIIISGRVGLIVIWAVCEGGLESYYFRLWLTPRRWPLLLLLCNAGQAKHKRREGVLLLPSCLGCLGCFASTSNQPLQPSQPGRVKMDCFTVLMKCTREGL
jgi:hypothetical protein